MIMLTRVKQVISLGSNVGSGLFIATGKALAEGGPGSLFIGYLIVCIGVWANLQCLTEMTIAFPTSGNYIDYADRWVDPALGFGAGLAEWLGKLYAIHWDKLLTSPRMDICICFGSDILRGFGQLLVW